MLSLHCTIKITDINKLETTLLLERNIFLFLWDYWEYVWWHGPKPDAVCKWYRLAALYINCLHIYLLLTFPSVFFWPSLFFASFFLLLTSSFDTDHKVMCFKMCLYLTGHKVCFHTNIDIQFQSLTFGSYQRLEYSFLLINILVLFCLILIVPSIISIFLSHNDFIFWGMFSLIMTIIPIVYIFDLDIVWFVFIWTLICFCTFSD